MAIPDNLTKEDLIKAADKIVMEGIPANAHSSTYDVFYKNQLLPAKLIISYANFFRNGKELDREMFPGGKNTECFKLLQDNGFKIYTKDNIVPLVRIFLDQANSGELRTAHFPKRVKGLDCKVGFGKGNQARVPWIAFLNGIDSVQNGIYPVYLYYKAKDLLVLAYGVSETKKTNRKWNLSNAKSITEYFSENNLGAPDRYGSSFVFKVYDTTKSLAEEEIDDDLNKLIVIYENTQDKSNKQSHEFQAKYFNEVTSNAGLFITDKTSIRFISSLLTKPFVILTGLSGSGKTKLAQAFSMWICEDESQYCLVPVGADWTNREPLLGFPNSLVTNDYKIDDYGVLNLIIKASKSENLHKPYFLILDEMNLSHVERYFADFLSVLESGKSIRLYDGTQRKSNGSPIQNEILWPENLFVIGTVNIDETTYMFSPKVLDRANVIEFRVTEDEMKEFLRESRNLDMKMLFTDGDERKPGIGANMAQNFLNISREKPGSDKAVEALNAFFPILQKAGAEFGYRSASEINLLIGVLEGLTTVDKRWDGQDIEDDDFIDIAIMQKLLPKLHGSRSKLVSVLTALGKLCINTTYAASEDGNKEFIKNCFDSEPEKGTIKYPVSFGKIKRMYKNVIANGYTSYAEA